jgi:dTDP-glucose pyrophosphorylase
MPTFVLDTPSASAAENVARIKIEIERANKHYIDTGEKATVQLGAGTWIVTGDKSGDKDDASTGAIELLSGVTLTGSGNRDTIIQLEDRFDSSTTLAGMRNRASCADFSHRIIRRRSS